MSAVHDEPGGRNDAEGALAARQPGSFLNAVERHFRAAAKDGEHGAIPEKLDGVVAPLAGGYLAAVKIENAIEFTAAEGDLVEGGSSRRRPAPVGLAGVDFAGTERHAAPPVCYACSPMIAP